MNNNKKKKKKGEKRNKSIMSWGKYVAKSNRCNIMRYLMKLIYKFISRYPITGVMGNYEREDTARAVINEVGYASTIFEMPQIILIMFRELNLANKFKGAKSCAWRVGA